MEKTNKLIEMKNFKQKKWIVGEPKGPSRKGKTISLITHDLALAKEGIRSIQIKDGRMTAPEEVVF